MRVIFNSFKHVLDNKYHMLLIIGGIILRKLKYNYSISCPMSACIITLLEYLCIIIINILTHH